MEEESKVTEGEVKHAWLMYQALMKNYDVPYSQVKVAKEEYEKLYKKWIKG